MQVVVFICTASLKRQSINVQSIEKVGDNEWYGRYDDAQYTTIGLKSIDSYWLSPCYTSRNFFNQRNSSSPTPLD